MSHPRKRIIIDKPGSYGVFRSDETPIDDPGPGEVQVEVKACGINFADVSVRLGLYQAAKGAYPLCPGLEFAGIVREIGPGIEAYRPGDKVFGACRFGGYTTAINSPAEHLWPLPEAWNFERGATFLVAYLTAYYALHHVGHLKESDRVLIHSAAGGVGIALLHLLKLNGNMSVGVVGRSYKADAAKEAGASFVIDKSTQGLTRKPLDYFKMFYNDTAINGSTAGLMCGYAFCGADHLLFGTDMPFDSQLGDRFVRQTIESIEHMEIPDFEKKMIFEDNARKLLRLPV